MPDIFDTTTLGLKCKNCKTKFYQAFHGSIQHSCYRVKCPKCEWVQVYSWADLCHQCENKVDCLGLPKIYRDYDLDGSEARILNRRPNDRLTLWVQSLSTPLRWAVLFFGGCLATIVGVFTISITLKFCILILRTVFGP